MDLVEKYEAIFTNAATLELVDIDLNISKLAAEYRANFDFKTPDAIQLAAADFCQADFFSYKRQTTKTEQYRNHRFG